jgi:hypothetical protein
MEEKRTPQSVQTILVAFFQENRRMPASAFRYKISLDKQKQPLYTLIHRKQYLKYPIEIMPAG